MLLLRGSDELAIGGHHVGGEQVVGGEAVLAHQPADPTAECESGDAGVADDAARGRQAVGLGLVVDITPQGTALYPGGPRARVDPYGSHL